MFIARGGAFLEEEFVSKEFSMSQSHLDEISYMNIPQPDPPSISSPHGDETSIDFVMDDSI